MKRTFFKFIMIILAKSFFIQSSFAQISNKAVFHRCYRQITQTYPHPTHELMKQVQAGTLDPIEACLKVLDKAKFTANNGLRIGNIQDSEAKNVLRTFQNLHLSWMTNKYFASNESSNFIQTGEFIDYNGPSLFITKALFTPNYLFRNIFTGNTINYESDRSNNDPDLSPNEKNSKLRANGQEAYPLTLDSTNFAAVGELYGIRQYSQKSLTGHPQAYLGSGEANFSRHWGGGVIGTNSYVIGNTDIPSNYRSDGGSKSTRKWGKAVLKDFLCRELPVIRYEDAEPFTNSQSTVAFRKVTGCVRCHATMDRMSGVIRNVRPSVIARSGGLRSLNYYRVWATNQPAESEWPLNSDYSYPQRPLTGTFYFRTHDGKLINQNLNGGEDLGKIIREIDAPYLCMAKKYYRYFTGVEVSLDDLGDPQLGYSLSEKELAHREEVINLGKNFKTHQSLRKLVEEILRKPQFSDAGYELKK